MSWGGRVQDEQKLIIGQVGLGKAREEKICCQTPLKAWRGLELLTWNIFIAS